MALTIEYLSDDCLIDIFRHLTVDNRLKLELVCHRWHSLMPYSDVCELNLLSFRWKADCISQDFEYHTDNVQIRQPAVKQYWLKTVLRYLLEKIGDNLRQLQFASRTLRCLISPEILEIILALSPSLKGLEFHNCFLQIDAIPMLRRFVKLQNLVLPCVLLNADRHLVANSSEILSELSDLISESKDLRRINLFNFKPLPSISGVHLQHLNLHCSGITDPQLQQICNISLKLKSICIGSCLALTDFTPLARLKFLHHLSIDSTEIKNFQLERIARNCTQLAQISMRDCRQVTDYTNLKLLRRLEMLWVGPSRHFNDRSLTAIAANGRLKNVNIDCCDITDTGISYLAANCPKLKEISATHMRISDQSVVPLLESCAQLQFINLDTTSVGNVAVATCGITCGQLEMLILRECPNLDELGFRKLLAGKLANASRKELQIVIGGRGATLHETLVVDLKSVNVTVIRRDPVLSLPQI